MSSERQHNLDFASHKWIPTVDNTIVSNALQVSIAAVANGFTQLGLICLSGTTGTGAAELLTVKSNSIDLYTDTFVVGTPKTIPFNQPLPAFEGYDLTVDVSATNLTAGILTVSYRIIPNG